MFTPLLIVIGDPLSYRTGAIFASILFTVTFLFGILGFFEEKELIDTYYSPNLEPQQKFFRDFFQRFSYAFKQKNFVLFLLRWLVTTVFNYFFVSGLVYYTEYILESNQAVLMTFFLIYYLMILVSIPIGFLISWFIGYLRTFNYSGLALGITVLMFTFVGIVANPLLKSVISLILMILIGFFVGLGIVGFIPIAGDTFDESASVNRKRSEGFLYGLLALFVGITGFVNAFVTTLVHTSTGFLDYYSTPPTSPALFGILILFSLIPGIVIIVIQVIFMIFYDLKPEKVTTIQEKNKELQI
jgi:Na+/melibiose symporter-like transporter